MQHAFLCSSTVLRGLYSGTSDFLRVRLPGGWGGGGVLDIYLGGEVWPGPSYPDPV